MRHHLRRAKHVYETRGLVETARTALGYVPIELNNLAFRSRYGTGTRVMDEEWDTLLVLDACRYDMFADRAEAFAGRLNAGTRLESRISLGSTSEEFLQRNFGDGTFHDTVYVNTNPYLPKLGLDDGTFHAVVDLLSAWDSESGTVRPETVVEAALDARERFPNKRLIVHFMQPHIPFIGKTGREITGDGWSVNDSDRDTRSVWSYLRDGKLDASTDLVWKAYTENLDIALSHVESLLDSISGRTVVSADHGNLVGEQLFPVLSKQRYGHPYGVYTPNLVKVPWFVVDDPPRCEIRTNPPVRSPSRSDATVEKRLRDLGYK